jgi:hypothetical protein
MKLTKVVFTHPTHVFGEAVSVLTVEPSGYATRVESIEVHPLGLLITKGKLVAWVPHSKAEGGQVVQEKGGKK